MDKTDDITLKELLRTFSDYKSEILSRKKLIFIVVLIFCVFAILLSKISRKWYYPRKQIFGSNVIKIAES